MSIVDPKLEALYGGVEIVHVIPLEDEIDRAVRVFEVANGFKANRVILLAWDVDVGGEAASDLVYYMGEVRRRLERLDIKVAVVHTNIWDMLEVIRRVSAVIREERAKGNIVYVNMSAGGAFVSVGTSIAAMVQDARLYYVRCQRYSVTREEKRSHGNAVVTQPQVHFLENFNIQLPEERGLRVMVELYRRGEMRTGDILGFLYEEGVEGFADEDPAGMTRAEKMTVLMRLNKGVTGKLEDAGYVVKERRGRENLYRITESGKYAACVSGLLG